MSYIKSGWKYCDKNSTSKFVFTKMEEKQGIESAIDAK